MFNLNLHYKCHITSNYLLGQEEFVIEYYFGDAKREKQYCSIIDETEPNFLYFQNHDFHNLSKGLIGNKIFLAFCKLRYAPYGETLRICKIFLII